MSARNALAAAHAAHVKISLDGEDIVFEAATVPPDDVLDLLRINKSEIIQLLRGAGTPDWWPQHREIISTVDFTKEYAILPTGSWPTPLPAPSLTCSECSHPISDAEPETWWGLDRVHHACGKRAHAREWKGEPDRGRA